MAKPSMIPEELLSSILSLLPSHALASVVRVCSTYRRIAEPLLYANVELRTVREVYNPQITTPRYTTCHLLHRSLQARGELALLIKTITMEARNPTFFVDLCSASETEKILSLPNLTTLILLKAQITMVPLKKLLSMTPNLQIFEFNSQCDCEPQDRFKMRYFDCGLLSSALEVVSGTLARLKITVEFVASTALEPENGGSYESRDSWGIKGSSGRSLQHFRQLKTIDVPWAVLLGWSTETDLKLAECLPEGLWGLVLAHDLAYFSEYGWDDRVCVGRLLDYLAEGSRPVGLESLGVRFDDEDEEEDKAGLDGDAWKRVEERCRGVGCMFYLEGREF